MKLINIQQIANLITEDPDIFCEMGGSMGGNIGQSSGGIAPNGDDSNNIDLDKPLTAAEIDQEAHDTTTNQEASDNVSDQLKMQQDMDKQQQETKKQVVEPQMRQLHQAMQKLNTGVLQGQQASSTGGEQFGALQ